MMTDLQLRSTNSIIFLTTMSQNPCHSSKLLFARPLMRQHQLQRNRIPTAAKKKMNPWLDAFDDGEDPEIEYDPLFSEGKQDEDERPPEDPTNPYGFLKFPPGHSVEIASLPLKIRGDVRRCCCVISGGVYENILFFPAIQLIKDRYPGVLIDVVTSPRGKQSYELNKNVRWANAYDPDADFSFAGVIFISCPIPKRSRLTTTRLKRCCRKERSKDSLSIVPMVENEIQKKKKRNTDCVYFLASPLTCNKGNECEFRHSETARLNPRDCWYWMSDSCLNPTCAFRHPPLEGCTETPPVPSSKSNVPCYYYFSFICNKGDQCPFSHGNDVSRDNGNDSKQPQEKKASNESHKRLSSAEPNSNHSGSISKEFSPSTEIEQPAVKSDNNDSVLADLASDNNSESVKDDLESGCESSPGFDVIVGNESERFPFDRNIDCRIGRDRDPEGLQRQLLPYEYGFSAGYDPFDYSTADFLQEPVMLDSYDRFDSGYNPDYPYDVFEPSTASVLEPPEWFHGTKIPPRENEIELCDPNDLRHRLLKNRRIDSNHFNLPHGDRSRSRLTECVVTFDGVSPEAELSVDDGTNSLSAQGGAKTHRHGRDGGYRDHSKHFPRRQERESRKRMKHNTRKHYPLRSEMSNDAEIDEAMPIVGRPKSFTQVKEQKRDGEIRRNGFRNPPKSSLEFEGPKSLSELLKQKKNQQKHENNAAESGGYRSPAENVKKSSSGGYKRRFSDDIDDDEYSE